MIRDPGTLPASREDNTSTVVGNKGMPLAQGEKMEQITRQGAAAAQADFDTVNGGEAVDLADGDWSIPEDTSLENPPDIGGTSEMGGGFVSESGNSFKVVLQWVNDDYTVLYEQSYDSKNAKVEFQSVTVKSDIFQMYVTDTSGAQSNKVTGTVNFH